ncbi:PE-PPE domain-containing protein [Mycolicibacterium hodleri]|nr:PE-PPE domain-containing protein [Mycolicibacterium hodleri]
MALGVAAALLPMASLPTAQAALPPTFDTGATVLVLSPVERVTVNDWLGGALCKNTSNNCVDVNYVPVNVPGGVVALDTAIANTPGPKIVFGFSGGAAVSAVYLQQHAADPVDENVSFVVIGNPTRKYGGSGISKVAPMPETGYNVIDISREYDSVSDKTRNPFNLLADANAAAGFMFIHLDYSSVDIYAPENTVWTEGNTTYVFVPTPNIPLLEPLRRLGLTELADALNAPLKAKIDRAYDRPYLVTPPPTDPPTDPPTTVTAAALPASSGVRTSAAQAKQTRTLAPAKAVPAQPAATSTAAVDTDTTTIRVLPKANKVVAQHLSSLKSALKSSASKPKSTTSTSSTVDGNKVEPAKVGGGQTASSSEGSKPAEAPVQDGATDGNGSSE